MSWPQQLYHMGLKFVRSSSAALAEEFPAGQNMCFCDSGAVFALLITVGASKSKGTKYRIQFTFSVPDPPDPLQLEAVDMLPVDAPLLDAFMFSCRQASRLFGEPGICRLRLLMIDELESIDHVG